MTATACSRPGPPLISMHLSCLPALRVIKSLLLYGFAISALIAVRDSRFEVGLEEKEIVLSGPTDDASGEDLIK